MREIMIYLVHRLLHWLWIQSLRLLYRVLDDPRTEKALVPVIRSIA